MKLLEKKARTAELKAETTLVIEEQKVEVETKMFQLLREVATAKARVQMYVRHTKDDNIFEIKNGIVEEELKNEVVSSRHQRSFKHGQPWQSQMLSGYICCPVQQQG